VIKSVTVVGMEIRVGLLTRPGQMLKWILMLKIMSDLTQVN